MQNRISKLRLKAFKKQSGRCYYCGSPMWQNNKEEFASEHQISAKAAARFQCTVEHLEARSDGGSNCRSNIVAACLICNNTRHRRKSPPSPSRYKEEIQKRLRKRKWHPKYLQHLVSGTV